MKPKIKIRKAFKYKKKPYFRNKPKKRLISPKRLILVEDQKRLGKSKKIYYLKKRILPKIQLIKKLHHFTFPKI